MQITKYAFYTVINKLWNFDWWMILVLSLWDILPGGNSVFVEPTTVHEFPYASIFWYKIVFKSLFIHLILHYLACQQPQLPNSCETSYDILV